MQGIVKLVDEKIEMVKNDIMEDVGAVIQSVSLLKTRIDTTTSYFKSKHQELSRFH